MIGSGSEIERLTLSELEKARTDFDAAVGLTPDIDRYCSSSHWVIPARAAFNPEAEPVCFTLPGNGFGAMMVENSTYWGRMLMPLEASWCLACPLVGPDPLASAMGLGLFLGRVYQDWDSALVTGLVDKSTLYRALLTLGGEMKLFRGPSVVRTIADLEGGRERYLARRSARFRNNIRRAERRCREAGIVLETHMDRDAPWTALLARAMAVESRSWKGREGAGVDLGPMRLFYDEMIARIGPGGHCRLILATLDGRDVGFILGGIHHGIYRGLQFSFDDDHRALSLGNLLQMAMIRQVIAEGVRWYDLGTDMDYKRRWADQTLETVSVLIRR